MNPHLTEIAFILDRSGSMASVTESAIAGFNEFLRDQQAAPGQARFTLVLFDNEYLVPVSALPIGEVAGLNAKTFEPRGSTALLDAIGRTVDELGRRLGTTPEADRPGKVIVAILTDGEENASRQYTQQDIASRISHQREKYGWEFLFLGANQDAIATAARMNITAQNTSSFSSDTAGTRASFKSYSRKASAMRAAAAAPSAPAPADLHMPLSDMVADEDRNERGKQQK